MLILRGYMTDSISDSHKDKNLGSFISRRLPTRYNNRHYTPYHVGMFLSRHALTIIDGVRISKWALMLHLMEHKLVPVKKTSLYKLDCYFTFGLILDNVSWTQLSENGRKAILQPKDLMWLILDIKRETSGGKAMGFSEIKEKLEKYIYAVYSKKNKLYELPSSISNHTLNNFVNTFKAQCVFNVLETVGNKTESRMIAEWSLRSTLAYTVVVASNHFIPNIQPTIYHPRKKDLNPDAVEL